MTLAQNLQQQLSGNKFIFLFITIFILAACSTTRKTQESNAKSAKEAASTQDSSSVQNSQSIDTVSLTLSKQDTYRIAVLLPFFLDSLNHDSLRLLDNPNYIYPGSKIAMELYQGIDMAIDSLKKLGAKLIINIYDTKKSVKATNAILEEPKFKDSDLIIGPVYNEPLRKVAAYAKKDSIPMVSPLSSSTNITLENPYYIMANATSKGHQQAMFDFMDKNFYRKNYIICYQDNYKEHAFVEAFYQFLSEDSIRAKAVEDSLVHEFIADSKSLLDTSKLNDAFDETKRNLLIIPSFSEPFANHILNQVSKLNTHGDFEIITLGMPTWSRFNSLRADQMQENNLHITSSYWVDKETHNQFVKPFEDKYYQLPTNFNYIGFDVFLYFGKALYNYGLNFSEHLDKVEEPAFHTNYIIEPSIEANTKTDNDSLNIQPYINHLENKFVHILRFKDYSWHKVEVKK